MLGQHEAGYPRNALTKRLLQNLGCTVTETASFAPGVLREAQLVTRFVRQASAIDVLFITEGGHRFVPVLAPIARALRIPVVFDAFTSRYNTYVEDRKTTQPGTLAAKRLHWMDQLAIHGADVCLFDTLDHASYFAERYGAPRRSEVIEVGVDERLFSALAPSAAPGFEVLFYGTYIPLQGVHVIVDAAERLRNDSSIAFTLVGSGQTHAGIAARVAALGLPNLRMQPLVPPEALPALIERAHVLLGVFGDTTKAANVVPNKVVQAAACARPILTRRSPAIERYFEDSSSALLVTPDAEGLAAGVQRLRDSESLRSTLAAGARAVFERHFSERVLTEKMARVLEATRAVHDRAHQTQ
jgi:glycosyltransferase involved in cell wall biosynthesis